MKDPSAQATLRDLPSVDQVCQFESIRDVTVNVPRPVVTDWVREALEDCRRRLKDGETLSPTKLSESIVRYVTKAATLQYGQATRHVINATGVLLHTNLGRAPLAEEARERVSEASAYCNVELDLHEGRRSERGRGVCKMIAGLTGAEDAVVVNNCAAATILVLHAVACGRDVIISRGQLVEIGGGFRLPEVFAAAGVRLCEVGTTNRTYLRDYEAACGESTGAIIRVHRGNFAQSGFVTEPSVDELVALERPDDLAVIDDVGSGLVFSPEDLGLPADLWKEPNVCRSIEAGADLVLFSGDKLYGGPQCGIVVGKQRWIDRLRRSPMMRAMRVDKLTLAALEATTELHRSGEYRQRLPLAVMLSRSADELREQAETLVKQLAPEARGEVCVEVVSCSSRIGGGSFPGAELPSFGVGIRCAHPDQLADQLRFGRPAIVGRVAEDQLVFDLRTIADHEFAAFTAGLRDVLGRASAERGAG